MGLASVELTNTEVSNLSKEHKHETNEMWDTTTSSSSSTSSCEVECNIEQQHPEGIEECSSQLHKSKAKLKSLLAQHNGSTKHPDVVRAVEELSLLNPANNDDAIVNNPYFLGDFQALTSPNFPGRIEPPKGQEGLVQYTLGRLSFNIFQPRKLVCTLRSVCNPVVKMETPTESDAKQMYSYPLVMDITIHTEDQGDLEAVLENEATCYVHSDKPGRVMVSFKGASLKPSEEFANDPENFERWSKTFDGAYKKAEEERSYFGQIGQYVMKMMLGLTYPTDELKQSFHFDIKRSPTGFLDVLYLDEDLRITKGNRGTIVVVERVAEN